MGKNDPKKLQDEILNTEKSGVIKDVKRKEETIIGADKKNKKEENIGLMNKETSSREKLREEVQKENKQEKEKMDFLKREDIRTMKKDIKFLREREAIEEGEEISLLGSGKKKHQQKDSTENNSTTSQKPIIPNFSKKTSSQNKILIRLLFIFLIILIGGGGYWFFSNQKQNVVSNNQPTEKKKEEINIPEEFSSLASTQFLNLRKKQRIITAVENLDANSLTAGLTRLVIKDSDGKLVPLNKIETIFGIKLPSEILSKIDAKKFNIVMLKREGKIEKTLIIEDQSKIENPNSYLEKTIKEKISPDNKNDLFESFKSENRNIRCLTKSSEYTLGLCYTTISNYFVVSESFDSMQSTLVGMNDLTRKKIGQLFIVGFKGIAVDSKLKDFISKYYPGGVLMLGENILSTRQIEKLSNGLQAISLEKSGQPLLIAIDQEGDPVSRISFLKELTPQKDITDANNAYQIGLKRGKELKKLGINLNLSPLMDNVNKNDYIYNRTFQKDSETAGGLGKGLIIGQQEAGIFSAVKHFPGYVGMTTNPENKLMITFSDLAINQFKEVMKVNPKFVMTANAIYNSIDSSLPFSFSGKAIKYLKQTLGRSPLIISDDLLQDSLINAYSLKEITSKPIIAGVDMEILSGTKAPVSDALDAFLDAVNNQEVSLDTINTAVSRIIKLKKSL